MYGSTAFEQTAFAPLAHAHTYLGWLQRSYWGKGPGNWGSVEKDQAEFTLALKDW